MADESKVQSQVMGILRDTPGCICYRITNITGASDLIACVGGRFLSIEVKDDKDGAYKLTKGQVIRLRKVARCGGIPCVVDKNNVGEFKGFVESVIAGSPVDSFYFELGEKG